ncbi:MAG: hypothetical protein R3C10_13310 [Pirellulales bacterium]
MDRLHSVKNWRQLDDHFAWKVLVNDKRVTFAIGRVRCVKRQPNLTLARKNNISIISIDIDCDWITELHLAQVALDE